MATDLFGIRVLDVDLDRREAQLCVYVVYYDSGSRTYLSPPERDPGFFLALLWQAGRFEHRIGEAVSVEQIGDRDWMVENARWFVEHVERTAVENDPPSEENWEQLQDFYYERFGSWEDEDLLVQADYTVRVTDPAWIEHLKPGQAWGAAAYPVHADCPSPEDLPHLPNVHDPVLAVPSDEDGIHKVAFSDDSRFLVVSGYDEELVVYDCADWSEHDRFTLGYRMFNWRLIWAPGRHVIVQTDLESLETRQLAYDVDARAKVEISLELGTARSRNDAHRIDFGYEDGVEFHVEGGESVRVSPAEGLRIEFVAFAEDESRLFAAGSGPDVHVIDTSSRRVVDKIPDVAADVVGLALSADGRYLATAEKPAQNPWEDCGHQLCVRRLSDREVVVRHSPGADIVDLAWSPDGRWLAVSFEDSDGSGETRVLRMGLPAESPAELLPAAPTA
ncbi:WD40 repeat domain-containing protein [Saccharopolyspora sp. NPDC050389]|uniref:WD40 repeat domain-containing protein n=1 Tax=Saccharopolyspora sp. NPDC050389 TaxID=3155516 RepID=UPI0033D7F2A9